MIQTVKNPRWTARTHTSRSRRMAGTALPPAVWLIALLLTCSACSGMQSIRKTQADSPMAAMEHLARSVLRGIENHDYQGLLDLAVTEEEYRSIIWPALPLSSQPGWQDNYDFVWNQHRSRSLHGLRRVLEHYGGRRFELLEVRCKKGMQDYGPYQVYRDAWLLVRNESGLQSEVNLFGSITRIGERYKIMSYTIR
jgi:hypothetical protein